MMLEKLGRTAAGASVLLEMSQGTSNAGIVAILGTFATTVSKHARHILGKFGVSDLASAMLIARQQLTLHSRQFG